MSDLSTAQRHAQGERILQAILHTIDELIEQEHGSLDADMVVSGIASALGTYIGNLSRAAKLAPNHIEKWSTLVHNTVVIPIAHKCLQGTPSKIVLPHTIRSRRS